MPEDRLDIAGSALGAGEAWECPPAWPRIAGCQIVRRLASGDRTEVFLAGERSPRRLVAVKVLRRSATLDADRLEACLREAWTAAALGDAAVVPVHRVGEVCGSTYLVTAYLEGGSLADVLRRRRLEPEEAARVGARIAGALAAAHRSGLVHEAVRPSNVLFDGRGNAFLADFGVGRLRGLDGLLATHAEYVAPELASGDGASDRATDLYALGVTLYEALTGRPPFRGHEPGETLGQHRLAPLPRLPDSVPEPLAAAVRKCLAKDPATRFRDPAELAEALGHAEPARKSIEVAEVAEVAEVLAAPRGLVVPRRRSRPWPLALGTTLVAVLCVAALTWHHGTSTSTVGPLVPGPLPPAASPSSGPAEAAPRSTTSSASGASSRGSAGASSSRSSREATAAGLAGSKRTVGAPMPPPQPAGSGAVLPAGAGDSGDPSSSSDADESPWSWVRRWPGLHSYTSPTPPPPTAPPPTAPPPKAPPPTAPPPKAPPPTATAPAPPSGGEGQPHPAPPGGQPRSDAPGDPPHTGPAGDPPSSGPGRRSDVGSGTEPRRSAGATSPGGRPSSWR